MALLAGLVLLFGLGPCSLVSAQKVITVSVGASSVTLPLPSRPLGSAPSVLWTQKSDEVHFKVSQGDDFRKQAPLFKGRTQMKPDALQTGNMDLTLQNPTMTDAGVFTCVTREGSTEVARVTVELKVTGDQVSAFSGSDPVELPCPIGPFGSEVSVLWMRGEELVHVQKGGVDDTSAQSAHFKGRTQMKSDALQKGDLGLVLKSPTTADSGSYSCVVTGDAGEQGRSAVQLSVRKSPSVVVIVGSIVGSASALIVVVLAVMTMKRCKKTQESCMDAFIGIMTCREPTSGLEGVC
ncbi:unnamed protein product [Knipowitschia caucasica]|uniref:Ig-like domain-containing protein n=1 Tax=Knipowitschia caucasica TaxID=637954 RepID=A0AAV2KMB5_KNICA